MEIRSHVNSIPYPQRNDLVKKSYATNVASVRSEHLKYLEIKCLESMHVLSFAF